MDIEIQQGTAADIEAIAQFQVDMALESEGTLLDRQRVLRGVTAVMEDPGKGRYIVAKVGDKVIGSMMLTMEWSDWNDGWYWWIQSVYVLPDYRGKGAFTAMYNSLKDAARQENVRELRLYVDKTNFSAQRRYQKSGMHESHYLMYEETVPPISQRP